MGLKIAVYAICHNEAEFVYRFMNSAKGADLIQIADTGSTDHTCKTIRQWAEENRESLLRAVSGG